MAGGYNLPNIVHRAASGEENVERNFVRDWLTQAELREQVFEEETEEEETWRSGVSAFDLQVYVPPPRSWLQRWFGGSPAQRLIEQTPSSLLILQQPHWPLQHILLIVRAESTDWTAFAWIERLARPRQTVVSILPIVPAWPRFHRATPYAQPTPTVLLARNTASGTMLNQMVQRLRQQQIATRLALTSGEPDWRIRKEVAVHRPELIVIAAESHNRLLRWLYGELVKPLLRWVECPLLITK